MKPVRLIANLLALLGFFVCYGASAQGPNEAIKNALPGSTQPGVIGKILATPPQTMPTALPPISAPEEQPSPLGPEAAQIKFKLTQIVLEENHVYSDHQLSLLYQHKLNTEISIAELQEIVQSITNFYRNNGYILSRAILPPQRVHEGVVHIRVIEGYVDQVSVVGIPRGAKKIIQSYGNKIAQSRPLQIKVMEHYLRLANEIPGVQVKAVLEPSKTEVGASNLHLSSETQTLTGSLSYDNYGTRYICPNQWTAHAALNSIFRPGDSTRAIYATTTRPQELKFYDVSYQAPIGTHGATLSVGKNDSTTRPGMDLAAIDTNGNSTTYYGSFTYPLTHSREKNLTLDGTFNYLDSQVTSFEAPLYTDHIRSLQGGANYDFADRFRGANLVGLHVEQGLNILGATNNPNSETTSRFGATGIFTKVVAQAMHLQPLRGRFSTFALINGQYSFRPLLASEQFAFGGSQLGRGYDPAEIIGDRGLSGSVELRLSIAPGWFLLNSFQPYVFYDAGIIWNMKRVAGIRPKQNATSAGLGSRFVFTHRSEEH